MRCGIAALTAALIFCSNVARAQPTLIRDTTGVGLPDSYRYFDEPVNPDIYLIRPGDKLVVTFINAKLAPITLVVNPEGNIVDQTLGRFDLSRQTLSQARETLVATIQNLYHVNDVAVSVTGPSRVGILVSGAVAEPGLHLAYTSQRVSELIDSAGGVLPAGSRRSIVLSGGPQDIAVDLDRVEYLGDNEANPCLYAGYRVHVPSKSARVVQVIGEVNSPREIELKSEDSLALLLQLAGGVRSAGDLNAVRVITNGQEPATLSTGIRPGDIIIVPARQHEHRQLVILGAIKQPGRYSYRDGFKLAELIAKAGGFAADAAAGRTTLFRRARVDEWGRTTSIRYPIGSVVDADGHVSEILLHADDSLFVPVALGYVKVTGEVPNPGLFPHQPGASAEHYIIAAGGYLPTAETHRVRVFDRVSRKTSTESPEVTVRDGDEVIVLIREELK